jgi:hypothetical protein
MLIITSFERNEKTDKTDKRKTCTKDQKTCFDKST